jgi:hypothetical protein
MVSTATSHAGLRSAAKARRPSRRPPSRHASAAERGVHLAAQDTVERASSRTRGQLFRVSVPTVPGGHPPTRSPQSRAPGLATRGLSPMVAGQERPYANKERDPALESAPSLVQGTR